MKTQTEAVLERLRAGPLTPLVALQEIGTFRLGARIWDLKQAGHNILTEWEQKGRKRYARYRLMP